MHKIIVVTFSTTLLTCWPGCPAFAVDENAAFQFSVLDFAVPTSPAFIAVDATPEAIIRPDTPRDFALELLNGTDPNGTLQTGMALDSVPYFLVYGAQTSLTDYQRWKWWDRALRTAGLSLATTKASDSDDDAVRLGVGLRATLLDLGDPRLDKAFVGCVRDQLEEALPESIEEEEAEIGRQRAFIAREILKIQQQIKELEKDPVSNAPLILLLKAQEVEQTEKLNQLITPSEPERNASIADAIESECQNNPSYPSNLWNRSAIGVGLAPTFISKSGELGDLEGNGVSVWATVAYGFDRFAASAEDTKTDAGSSSNGATTGVFRYLEDHAQLLIHARYRPDQNAIVGDTFVEEDLLTLASRFRLVYNKFNLNAEGAFLDAQRQDAEDDSYYRLSFGADIRLPHLDNIYLSLNIGGELGRDDEDSTFLASALKWRFGPEPTIQPSG